MLSKAQIEGAKTAELEGLRRRLDAELTRRELAERKQGRRLVEERPHGAGTLRSEMVRCGKDRCKKCSEGGGHGAYWYSYARKNGKLTSKYIGKKLPPEMVGPRRIEIVHVDPEPTREVSYRLVQDE